MASDVHPLDSQTLSRHFLMPITNISFKKKTKQILLKLRYSLGSKIVLSLFFSLFFSLNVHWWVNPFPSHWLVVRWYFFFNKVCTTLHCRDERDRSASEKDWRRARTPLTSTKIFYHHDCIQALWIPARFGQLNAAQSSAVTRG